MYIAADHQGYAGTTSQTDTYSTLLSQL